MQETILIELIIANIKAQKPDKVIQLLHEIPEDQKSILITINKTGYAIVHYIAMYGLVSCAAKIKEKFPHDFRSFFASEGQGHFTSFIFSVVAHKHQFVEYLMKEGVDDFATPLHRCMFMGSDLPLNTNKNSFLQCDSAGFMPIFYAAAANHSKHFEIALQKTPDKRIDRKCLVECMIKNGHKELAEIYASKFSNKEKKFLEDLIYGELIKIVAKMANNYIFQSQDHENAAMTFQYCLMNIISAFFIGLNAIESMGGMDRCIQNPSTSVFVQWQKKIMDKDCLAALLLILKNLEMPMIQEIKNIEVKFLPIEMLQFINMFGLWLDTLEPQVLAKNDAIFIRDFYHIRVQILGLFDKALKAHPLFCDLFIKPLNKKVFILALESVNARFLASSTIDLIDEENKETKKISFKISGHKKNKKKLKPKEKIVKKEAEEIEEIKETKEIKIAENQKLNAKKRSKLKAKAKMREKNSASFRVAASEEGLSKLCSIEGEPQVYSKQVLNEVYGKNKLLKLPRVVVNFLAEFHQKTDGKKIFLMGGAVRDMLLGKYPNDFDFLVSVDLEELKKIFPKSVWKGRGENKTLVLCFDCDVNGSIQQMLFDIRSYKVNHSDNTIEDLKSACLKGDLTINSLLYHPEEGLIDFLHGIKHLKEKKIIFNCIIKANLSVVELMRMLRFSVNLNAEIPEADQNEIKTVTKKIIQMSGFQVSDTRLKQEYQRFIRDVGVEKTHALLKEYGLYEFLLLRRICFSFEYSFWNHLERATQKSLACTSKTAFQFFKNHKQSVLLLQDLKLDSAVSSEAQNTQSKKM